MENNIEEIKLFLKNKTATDFAILICSTGLHNHHQSERN